MEELNALSLRRMFALVLYRMFVCEVKRRRVCSGLRPGQHLSEGAYRTGGWQLGWAETGRWGDVLA